MEREEKDRKINTVRLLDKIRKIQKLLYQNNEGKVVFSDICDVMSDVMEASVFVLSRKGKVLGCGRCEHVPEITENIQHEVGTIIDKDLNERFRNILSTNANISLLNLGFESDNDMVMNSIVVPVQVSGERLGTVFIYADNRDFDVDDIILAEYGTTVVSLEILRAENEESAEERRRMDVVKSAVNTLSYSEIEAIIHIFDELGGTEGILIASKIADRAGITRSVIVNALRKLESAGVLESRSSGMRGTYIRVLNDAIYSELDELRAKAEMAGN